MNRAPLVSLLVLVATACDSQGSATVRTAEMGMSVLAIAHDSGEVAVDVSLTTNNPALLEVTYVELEPGDSLIAALGASELELREEYVAGLNLYRYTGSLVSTERELGIRLERATEESALSSRVTIPTAFAITSPPSSHVRGQPLTIRWDVANEVPTTRVLVSGDCIVGSEVRIDADPGSAEIPAAAFELPSDGGTLSDPCTVNVQLDRMSEGTLDVAFGRSGRIEAAQTRAFELAVTSE